MTTHLLFDLEGTLYDLNSEQPGLASVTKHQRYLRLQAFSRSQEDGIEDETDFLQKLQVEYARASHENEFLSRIAALEEKVGSQYDAIKKEEGNNYLVFQNLFQTRHDFMGRMMGIVDFRRVLKIDPQLLSTLGELRKSYEFGMITSDVYTTAQKVCEVLGVPFGWFWQNGHKYPIICGDIIAKKKPCLDAFHEALEQIDTSPENIGYIGDSFEKDISPALSIGMSAFHVLHDQKPPRVRRHNAREYVELGNLHQLKDVL